MEKIYVLDSSFEVSNIIDVYESLIWTIRYREAGEFELFTPITVDLVKILQVDRYLFSRYFYDNTTDTAELMIIETIEIDNEHLKVTGRCLKSLLARRIVWGQKVISANTPVITALQEVIRENVTDPLISERQIPNFSFDTTSGDWGTITDETQYEGNSVMDVVNDICEKYKLGYDVYLSFVDKKFHMRLITPVDHSYEQTDAAPVVFSAKFNNLASSKYLESVENEKNVAYVSGEKFSDDEAGKWHQTATIGDASGLNRRELFVDASSITHVLDDGTEYSIPTYQTMLEQKGQTELNKVSNSYSKIFEGEADIFATGYKFGVDYKIGDIVEIVNQYDIYSASRITEIVLSVSTKGITAVPTFEAVKEEDDE